MIMEKIIKVEDYSLSKHQANQLYNAVQSCGFDVRSSEDLQEFLKENEYLWKANEVTGELLISTNKDGYGGFSLDLD